MLPIHAIALVSVGSFTPGAPTTDNAQLTASTPFTASVSFVSSSAGATGTLFFQGVRKGDTLTPPSVMDDPELGRDLFSNHGASDGDRAGHDLGAFAKDDVLRFAYLVTDGVRVAPTGSLFTTEGDTDPAHFTVLSTGVDGDTTTYRVGVEDIRDASRSDWDYNDVVFDVAITAVPTPGSGALALAGLAIMARRRRS